MKSKKKDVNCTDENSPSVENLSVNFQSKYKCLYNINEVFKSHFDVNLNPGAVSSIIPYNMAEVNDKWASDKCIFDNEIVAITQNEKMEMVECSINVSSTTEYGEVRFSKAISDFFCHNSNHKYMIFKFASNECKKIYPQSLSNIKSGVVAVNPNAYNKINQSFTQQQIIHTTTGSSYIVSTSKFICDKSLNDGAIRFSYYQRQLLNLELPPIIPSKAYASMRSSCDYSKEELEKLDYHFLNCERHKATNYEEKQKLMKLLEKSKYSDIQIVPVLESYKNSRTFVRPKKDKLFDWFIGGTDLVLKCCRPYSVDENKDIVRLSKDSISLLGIEETDHVVLRYRDKSITAKVMAIDSIIQIKETNIINDDSDEDLIAGIPAHLRKKLGVNNINTTISIERDTLYLFRKNLNIQFLPIIALLFTLLQTFENYALVFTCFFAFLPLVMFIVFSSERNKVK